MDFRTATDEVSSVEGSAMEYNPAKHAKRKVERSLELSPPDIHEMEYADIINQYKRMEKIISASHIDIGMGAEGAKEVEEPGPAPDAVKKEAAAVEQEMKKISEKSAQETAEISAPVEEAQPPTGAPPEGPAPVGGPAAEIEKSREVAEEHVTPGPAEVQETVAPEPGPREAEEAGEGEITPELEAPALPTETEEPELAPPPTPPPEVVAPAPELPTEMGGPGVWVAVPTFLSASPVQKAEETITRLETQLGAQMTGKTTKKVDTEDTKKRMMELTRELFKERSMDRRAEIKKEIVSLKALLSKAKGGKAAEGGLPKGALFTSLRNEQEYELKDAKNKIQGTYEENQKRLLPQMDAQRAVEHRGPAFEKFSASMVDLEQKLVALIEKYQNFLTAKHTAELSKLKAKGQSTPESETLKTTIKELYTHDFSSLKNSIGEEIHSQLDTTRAALFEEAGNPKAQKLVQIANAPEDSLFNLLQAKDRRTYERYARGEMERSEALLAARRLMAKDAGIDEDTINKRFGGK